MRITKIRHPEYTDDETDWFKWRLAYKGGRQFIDNFLQRFSKREDDIAFAERKTLAHCPAFAKAAINKLKNTFYSRMAEIVRIGGPDNYTKAIAGLEGGVDLHGSSMNSFLGQEVLPELLTMRKVGVYVDKPALDGNLLARNQTKKPYLYIYQAEDICTWDCTYYEGEYIYTNVLLRDTCYIYDEVTGLAKGEEQVFRHIWLAEDGVHIQLWKENEDDKAEEDIKFGEEVLLNLDRIPFIVLGLQESLMADVADYQVGLLNLSSADTAYVYRANFPIWVEQFDPAAESVYQRRPRPSPNVDQSTGKDPGAGTRDEGRVADGSEERRTGVMHGRKYPKGLDAPTFIAPPAEPLRASLEKQAQMRSDIEGLVDIAAANAVPTHASAESKSMDDRSLESGLSCIGMELEYAERRIAELWAMYENMPAAEIYYPSKYSLKSDEQRLKEAESLDKIKSSAPSRQFAKEIGKRIAHVMLADKVTQETLSSIMDEIDKAEYISADPELIKTASELGMVDAVTGSNALGFNGKDVVPIAQKEHAERLATIAEHQAKGAARGVPDQGPVQGKDQQGKDEKAASQKDKDNQSNPAEDKTRGKE